VDALLYVGLAAFVGLNVGVWLLRRATTEEQQQDPRLLVVVIAAVALAILGGILVGTALR